MFTNVFRKDGIDIGPPTTVTIGSTGALAVFGKGHYSVTSYTSTTDAVTSITGCQAGDVITLRPTSTHTITVTDGTNLKLGGDHDFVMNNISDNITLYCESAGVFSEVMGRVSNG